MTHSSLWCDVFQSAAAVAVEAGRKVGRKEEREGGRQGGWGTCISSPSHCPWSSAPVKEGTLMTEGPFVCDSQAGNDI